MERKCPECGSTEVMEGTLNAMGGMAFVPCGQDRVILRGSYLQALACRKGVRRGTVPWRRAIDRRP